MVTPLERDLGQRGQLFHRAALVPAPPAQRQALLMERYRTVVVTLELRRDAEHEQRLGHAAGVAKGVEEGQRLLAEHLYPRGIGGVRGVPHQAEKRLGETSRISQLAEGSHALLSQRAGPGAIAGEPHRTCEAVQRRRHPDPIAQRRGERMRLLGVARCLGISSPCPREQSPGVEGGHERLSLVAPSRRRDRLLAEFRRLVIRGLLHRQGRCSDQRSPPCVRDRLTRSGGGGQRRPSLRYPRSDQKRDSALDSRSARTLSSLLSNQLSAACRLSCSRASRARQTSPCGPPIANSAASASAR